MLKCVLQDFRGVIQRSKAVILVAEAMPELAALDFDECVEHGVSLIPAECHGKIAFMRVWCLVRVCLLPIAVCLSTMWLSHTD